VLTLILMRQYAKIQRRWIAVRCSNESKTRLVCRSVAKS